MASSKAPPLASLGFYSSVFTAMDMLKPDKVTYPYLMVIGEKDVIVNN